MIFNCSALQVKTGEDFEKNLEHLKYLIQHSGGDLVLAPEVCLTNFCYERFEESAKFSKYALDHLLPLSRDRLLALTMNVKKDDKFYNQAVVMHNQEIIHTQEKYKLFTLGDEGRYYAPGDRNDIKVFEAGGLKIAVLNCFELRFASLWQQVAKADVIMIPAQWGRERKEHLRALSKALAIMNQCYVIVADGANDDMAKSSAVISPFGAVLEDDDKEILSKQCSYEEIEKMRRYIRVYE
ncbi:MAG: nitrilase-related carbon-nitrogen hydrolase [Campylobacterota bacterium]